MSTLLNNKWALDTLDNLIINQGLRIKDLYFDKELDLMLVILNNRKILTRSISNYKLLKNASLTALKTYELSKTGIHWPDLDEDLSLRGFLEEEMISTVTGTKVA